MNTDIRILEVEPYFDEIKFRTPLKFGGNTINSGISFTVRIKVENKKGNTGVGWGNVNLSYNWAFPSEYISAEIRENILVDISKKLSNFYKKIEGYWHPIELYYNLKEEIYKKSEAVKIEYNISEQIPALATLICNSPFDTALHDALGKANNISTFKSYSSEFMAYDLSRYLGEEFSGEYLSKYIKEKPAQRIPVFHLVGGVDKLRESEIDLNDPNDGLPVSLDQWIERDGIFCFKIKLSGEDIDWDVERTIEVAEVARESLQKKGVKDFYLSTDSNEKNKNPESVMEYLDKLKNRSPEIFDRLLYLEQPTERDLDRNQFDMSKVSKIKSVVVDEGISGIDKFVQALELGWSGAALKICKGFSSALLYVAMSEKYNLEYSVQDLTNTGISLIHSASLTSRIEPIMGFEYNSRQFMPEAYPEIRNEHSDIFKVKDGYIHLNSLKRVGLGY